MPVTLKNTSNRMRSYNLDHVAMRGLPEPLGYRTIQVTVVDHDGKSGALFPRRIPKQVCSALYLAAGETKSGLPNEVLLCEAIKQGIAAQELRVLSQTTDEQE